MSDDNKPEVDPRFDPAFQRGFDQTIPIEEYVPAPLSRTGTAPARTTGTPVSADRVASTPPRAVSEVIVVADPEPETGAEDPVVKAGSESNLSRNPFLLFLGVISIALVATGVWLFVRSGDAFNSREVRSQGDYMSLDATIHMAPFIALLGAATAIGVLFVFADNWRRKR